MNVPLRLLIGNVVVEPLNGLIRSDGVTHKVEPKAIDVLLCLARRSPETVSKNEVFRMVWPNTVVTEHVLTRCISQLRKALGGGTQQPLILTVYKRGYRLTAQPVFHWRGRPTTADGTPPRAENPRPPAGVAGDLDLAQILSSSRDHIYLFDRECRYLFANVSGARALGLDPEAMIGRQWRELELVPEILEPFEAQVMLAFSCGETSVTQVSYPTVYGERFFEYVLDPVHDRAGEIVAVLAIVRDITHRGMWRNGSG